MRTRNYVLLALLCISIALLAVSIPTALAASITLNPTSGPPGTVIGISGSGFAPSTSGYVWFDTDGNSSWDASEPRVTRNTNSAGSILPSGDQLIVPEVAGGTYYVRADIPSGNGIEANATFTVRGILITPSNGRMDTVVTISVTGVGFAASTAGYVWFDTNGDSVRDATEPNSSVTTSDIGAIPSGVTLDTPLLPPGQTYYVRADIPTGLPIEARAEFKTSATTTALTVTKYDFYGNVIGTRYISYQEMAANMTVQGDGTTHYYHQGPIFEDEWEACYGLTYTGGDWGNSSEKWDRVWNATTGVYDQMEECNYKGKDYGACRGTNVSDLCELVGGMFTGETVRIKSPDGFSKNFSYDNVYEPEPRQGPMVVTWYTKWEGDGVYVSDNYTDGMRLIFFADTSTNNASDHVFGIGDTVACLDPQYYHYYPEGGILYPTTTGLSVKWISDIIIDSNERCGDVDRNGEIKYADVGKLKQHYFNSSVLISEWAGDVDCSGGIKYADVGKLKQHYFNSSFALDCCTVPS